MIDVYKVPVLFVVWILNFLPEVDFEKGILSLFLIFVVIILCGVAVGIWGDDASFTGFSIALWAMVILVRLEF